MSPIHASLRFALPLLPGCREAFMSEPLAASPEITAGVVPQTLGSYQIIRQLGRGGMGAVYLARQIMVDRPVALKVMNPEWAQNPAFLVRSTREAYAAAQLAHHNFVQVHDIGSDRGLHYIIMEYVEGQTLGQLQKEKRKLAAEEAVGYILQAARGLRFAHERGMIHRDIKPDNIMVNQQGVVKVADLGLVRRPAMEEVKPVAPAPPSASAPAPLGSDARPAGATSGHVTEAGLAVGTPGYMAPEQAKDADLVDARSDVYSLGCTLYVMVTGRPVFNGNNIAEVLAKHASEPVSRPETIVKHLPRALSDVIVKMIAKRPEERYSSMAEVTRVLEDLLQIEGAGRLAQNEQHVRMLVQGFNAFQSAGSSTLRKPVFLGFFGGCAALFVFFLLIHTWRIAACILGVGLLTALAQFMVHGLTHRTHLFQKIREVVLSITWRELIKPVAALLLLCLVLWLFGLLLVWILAALLATFLAVGFHYGVERRIARERALALDNVEAMLKTLRLRGVSEEALQEFVCKNADDDWEEFFEALFGYESKLAARVAFVSATRAVRPRFGAWRDPLVRWLDHYQKTQQQARVRRYLEAVEQSHLVAQGIAAAKAREEAERVAAAKAVAAAELHKEADAAPEARVVPEAGVSTPAPSRPSPRRVMVQDIFQARPPIEPSRKSSPVTDLLEVLLGSSVRFTVGALLLVTSLWWLNDRGLLPGSKNFDDRSVWRNLWEQGQQDEEQVGKLLTRLTSWMPEVVRRGIFSLGAGIAGLVLLVSAAWRSPKIGLMTLAGAAVMVFGPVSGHVESIESATPFLICLTVGGSMMVLGFLFGRDT
jgi:serine/threonine protein kinase